MAGVPTLLLAACSTWLIALGGDFAIADLLYRLQGGAWAYKSTWLATDVMHVTGRNLSVLAWSLVVCGWLASLRLEALRTWRRPLAYLVLATFAGVALTSLLKASSGLDCPWDLTRYGGSREFLGWFATRSSNAGGRCFPAGHASAGYAWLALYFFLSEVAPDRRRWGLVVGSGVGLLFGVSQQLRGAHFLSHDVWTAAICWFAALALHAWMFSRPPATRDPREIPHGG